MISLVRSHFVRLIPSTPGDSSAVLATRPIPRAPSAAKLQRPEGLARGLRPARAYAASSSADAGRFSGNPFGENFAGRLLHATAREHGALSKHPLIAQLKGADSAEPYAQLLRDKRAFYAALEELLSRHAGNSVVGALLAVPGLPRAARLQSDLAALAVPGEVSAAAEDYVAFLRSLAGERPEALAVHAWLNYLAEMFGGQGLRRALQSTHGAAAVTSFEFDSPVEALIPQALHCFDASVAGNAEAALIAEARVAYGWSKRLFDAASQ